MKIGPVGATLFRADRRTEGHDEANTRFSQFCERAPKIGGVFHIRYIFSVTSRFRNHLLWVQLGIRACHVYVSFSRWVYNITAQPFYGK